MNEHVKKLQELIASLTSDVAVNTKAEKLIIQIVELASKLNIQDIEDFIIYTKQDHWYLEIDEKTWWKSGHKKEYTTTGLMEYWETTIKNK